MKTTILKWNPNFSSYSMYRYLRDIVALNFGETGDFNWSVWDYDKIHEGDRFYWLKLGQGATGIFGAGKVASEPYKAEDWSGKGRDTYYVDIEPELLINPDALPIFTTTMLEARIPGFDWTHGHSGLVLDDAQAATLNSLWEAFVQEHAEEFMRKKDCGRPENDYIYWEG